jgi:hypothetical protein
MKRNILTNTPSRADAMIWGALRSVTDLQTYCIWLVYTDQCQPFDVKLLYETYYPGAVMLSLT